MVLTMVLREEQMSVWPRRGEAETRRPLIHAPWIRRFHRHPLRHRKPDSAPTFEAEGILREALLEIWEQARAKGVGENRRRCRSARSIPTDGFRLLGPAGSVSPQLRKEVRDHWRIRDHRRRVAGAGFQGPGARRRARSRISSARSSGRRVTATVDVSLTLRFQARSLP